jgi:hypothetical protein
MLALFACVTLPILVRRFSIHLGRSLWRSVLLPTLASAPAAAAVAVRPRLGKPLLDLLADALVFGLALLPWLPFVRRWLREPGSA